MKRRVIRILILVSMGIILQILLLVGCYKFSCNVCYLALDKCLSNVDCSFENRFKTSEDGFKYYIDEKIGLCIVGFPDTEVVRIPKYINGYEVMQLGYEEIGFMYTKIHRVDCRNVKHLIFENKIRTIYASNEENIETITYVGFFDYITSGMSTEIEPDKYAYLYLVDRTFLSLFEVKNLIELRNAEIELEPIISEELLILEIPEYVTVIEEGFFDRYENMIIRTSYKEKPEGWEDGWNGNCEVEWGAELEYYKYLEDRYNKNNNK